MHMNHSRKVGQLNLMVIGRSFIGKSSLINTLCRALILEPDQPHTLSEQDRELRLESCATDAVSSGGQKVALKIVVVRDYQSNIDNTDCVDKVIKYLRDTMTQQLHWEAQLKRTPKRIDYKMHACLYLLPPGTRGLSETDAVAMKKLSLLVNIIPIIAKSDTLTPDELEGARRRIIADIELHGIGVLQLEEDCDPEAAKENEQIRSMLPFSIVNSNHLDGGWKYRSFSWGKVPVEEASDIGLLRQVLFETHLESLLDYSHNVIYENFRYDMLTRI